LSFLRTAKIKVARRESDPSTLIASDEKAKKELNFSPDKASHESFIKISY
jgi:UDP-glucose 4-epimerase